MIRLAIAVGFLGVFGFVAWAVILLLTKHFKTEEKKDSQLNPKENDKQD